MTTNPAQWSILTAPNARGAVAVVALESPHLNGDLDADLARLRLPPIAVGGLTLADLLGVDRGLIARWSETRADLFTHGGPAIVRALTTRLTQLGITPADIISTTTSPEARTPIEAAMLAALARAASPRAVDLLLDQPRRHADVTHQADPDAFADPRLDRLIDPPLVAALGPPNIGKSTLLNALAGRSVALAADRPGTTRDHVGATLDLDGLTVRYLDLPGLDPTAAGPDAAAQALAHAAVRTADLILLCSDPTHPAPPMPQSVPQAAPQSATQTAPATLTVGLRADLGPPLGNPDLTVCAHTRAGLPDLARAVRRALVPDSALADPRPWAFDATPGRV